MAQAGKKITITLLLFLCVCAYTHTHTKLWFETDILNGIMAHLLFCGIFPLNVQYKSLVVNVK